MPGLRPALATLATLATLRRCGRTARSCATARDGTVGGELGRDARERDLVGRAAVAVGAARVAEPARQAEEIDGGVAGGISERREGLDQRRAIEAMLLTERAEQLRQRGQGVGEDRRVEQRGERWAHFRRRQLARQAIGELPQQLGAGVAGLAVLGASIGQGNAARGALEGMARNPAVAGTIQTAMLLGLAFIESLVIFTLIIALFLQGKIG